MIEWKDIYAINNDEIDTQHKNLFDIVNRFLMATDNAHLDSSRKEMYSYIEKHFEQEEELMRKIHFPYYHEHLGQHDNLLIKLNRVSLEIISNKLNRSKLEDLITEWAINHIPREDVKLLNYVADYNSLMKN
jgi:hemerythrin